MYFPTLTTSFLKVLAFTALCTTNIHARAHPEPEPEPNPRPPHPSTYTNPWGTATITLITPGTQVSITVPQDGTVIYTYFTDSISHIATSSQLISIAKHCKLQTSTGSSYALEEIGFNYFAVGPPQVVESLRCWNPVLLKDRP